MKEIRSFKSVLTVSLPLLGMTVVAPGIAMASSSGQLCDRSFARNAATELDIDSLCGCDTITTGFIERIQRHKNFDEILQQTSETCPGLATILADLPTASISAISTDRNGEDRDSDENPDEDGGNPGNGGGRKPGVGNEEPGDGGENPGGGSEEPSDGGEEPGDGGEDPGDGGENPDNGAGGKDKPNNGNKPGDKGDNGHGNDEDGNDDSNPGNSNDPDDSTDDDGTPGNSGNDS